MSATTPSASPAEIYEARFLPALFLPVAERVVHLLHPRHGDAMVDVACGTGALARTMVRHSAGRVVGVDAMDDMLAVARRADESIEWMKGRAEALPLPDATFDACGCQFAMMFFDDAIAALAEMRRVLRPGGRMVVAVGDTVERSGAYAPLSALLRRLFGERVANAFDAPFALGDPAVLMSLAHRAGWRNADIMTVRATVCFASVDGLISAERACIWTLGGLLDDHQFERLQGEAGEVLSPWVGADGKVSFELPMQVLTASKR